MLGGTTMPGFYKDVLRPLRLSLQEKMPKELVDIVIGYALELPPEPEHYDPKPGSGRRLYLGRPGQVRRHIGDVLKTWDLWGRPAPGNKHVASIEAILARRLYPGNRPNQLPTVLRMMTMARMEPGFKVLSPSDA